MGEVLREASFSLAEAKFAAGDFSHIVIQNVSRAQHRVRMKKENVVGKQLLLLFALSHFNSCLLIIGHRLQLLSISSVETFV